MKTLDKILICLAVFLLTFIVAMVIIFCVKDAIPDTLVACVLSGSGIELIVAAWIQTTKEKNKNSDLVEEEGEEDETSR